MIGGPPKLGWVIRYEYDWNEPEPAEARSAVKERPAVIVLSVQRRHSVTLVRVAPVTHQPPADPTAAIEIPTETKRRLGLDDDRSWILLDHANEFIWPGPDLRPVPGRTPVTIYYGVLPPILFERARRSLLSLLKAGRVRARFRPQ